MLVRHPARGDGSAAPPTAPIAAPLAANTGAVSAPAGAAPQSATPVAFAPPASAASQPPAPANAGGAAATVAEQNAADYAPAAEPAAASLSHVRRTTAEGVPLYQDAAATPGSQLPQLRLDLHVFAARPEDRFVMINMHKLREGDSFADGVHVDSITADGVVLTYNGSRFLLPRD
jgi:general secretion pathway protein B